MYSARTSSPSIWRKVGAVLAGLAMVITTTIGMRGAEQIVAPNHPLPLARDQSFRNEIEYALSRGLTWLQANQNSNGWWSTPDQPAITALALTAFKGDAKARYQSTEPDWLKKGYRFVLGCVQPDGGIHRTNLVTYNTSLSMMALLATGRPEYDPVIRKARKFLIGLQRVFGEKGKLDQVFDGGIGYG